MTPSEFVRALYKIALGREADSDGLSHWIQAMESRGDPSIVLRGILDSQEFRLRCEGPQFPERLRASVTKELATETLTIVDVGAQRLAWEDHVYSPLCKLGLAHHVIGFEPLEERLTERASVENGASLTLLPYAVGDGRPHTFYINNEDATSSLFPLNEGFCSAFEGLMHLKTVRETTIETVRLDDALVQYPIPIDFLKLDIQGGELAALAGAETVLERTAVVHCEVEFAPIYEGQPLFPEIQAFLNARGFTLIDILVSHRYAYVSPSNMQTPDRLIWADAVFFRQDQQRRTLLSQALTAFTVYRKLSLAEHMLNRALAI
jgi:FkbM family methyltransferase